MMWVVDHKPLITLPGSQLTLLLGWLDTDRNIYLCFIMHKGESSKYNTACHQMYKQHFKFLKLHLVAYLM